MVGTSARGGERPTWFAVGFAAYVVVASVVVGALEPAADLASVGFLFGPAIERVAGGGALTDASRLPLVPMVLGAIARVSTSVVVATILKNVLFAGFVGRALWEARGARTWIVAVAFAATFPALVRHGFAIVPEEGYLVPLVAVIAAGVVGATPLTRARHVIPFACAAALALLAKSSAAPLAIAAGPLYAWRARSARVLGVFVAIVGAAAIAWGAQNLAVTGRFSIGSSMDGYNFWKGNNALTLAHFPERSLDVISDDAPRRGPDEGEWAWDRRCFDEGLRFDRAHPVDAMRIFAARVYQVFLAVTPETPADGRGRGPARLVGVPHMIAFRVLLLGSIAWAVRTLLWRRAAAVEERRRALAFLVVVAAFTAPFLVAWGVERRLVPLVLPTLLFVLHGAKLAPNGRTATGG